MRTIVFRFLPSTKHSLARYVSSLPDISELRWASTMPRFRSLFTMAATASALGFSLAQVCVEESFDSPCNERVDGCCLRCNADQDACGASCYNAQGITNDFCVSVRDNACINDATIVAFCCDRDCRAERSVCRYACSSPGSTLSPHVGGSTSAPDVEAVSPGTTEAGCVVEDVEGFSTATLCTRYDPSVLKIAGVEEVRRGGECSPCSTGGPVLRCLNIVWDGSELLIARPLEQCGSSTSAGALPDTRPVLAMAILCVAAYAV